jgi:hypothetical protein
MAPPGSVTIRCVENGKEFTFTLSGNSIPRPTVAVALALDQSGSMDEQAGTGGTTKRIEVLRESASRFVELIQANNGIGIIRFDSDAYPVDHPVYGGFPITKIGTGGIFDPTRVAALSAVQNHNTNLAGATSIGDGVALARSTLTPISSYDHKAIIVFTDGLENMPQTIANVMSSINNRTYAIGLGSEHQISTAALRALANGTGGYLLVTGHLTANINDYFRLSKYFLQILAGVTNSSIVIDPTDYIYPDSKIRIPFVINDADIDCTIVLLVNMPVMNLRVETPTGEIIDPSVAAGFGGTYAVGTNMVYYHLNFPVPLGPSGSHAGTWNALLEVDKRLFKKYLSKLENDKVGLERARAHGAGYNLSVHSLSNLRMEARLDQNSLEPGASMMLRAVLTEYGEVPVAGRATVIAKLHSPDNTTTELSLVEVDQGVFETTIRTTVSGVYQFRIMASGLTMRGSAFTREQLLTGAVFQGGDGPFPFGGNDPNGHNMQLCHLLQCLFNSETVRNFFSKYDIDGTMLIKCIKRFCEQRMAQPSESGLLKQDVATIMMQDLTRMLEQPGSDKIMSLLSDLIRKAKQ